MTLAMPQLEPLEVATGMPIGAPRGPKVEFPAPRAGETPREALRAAILPALLRPPCVVSFSGGRDSSAILAVAVEVAAAEGLSPPVPVTLRFPEVTRTREDDWQEHVIRHLRLTDWLRMDMAQELDLIGPVRTAMLREHGLSFPPQVHFLLPVVQRAYGGTVLTGTGGDELFIPWNGTSRSAWRLAARVRSRAAVSAAVLNTAPDAAKRALLRRRLRLGSPWLTPKARGQAVKRQVSGRRASRSYAEALQNYTGSRSLELLNGSLKVISQSAGAHVLHPFLDLRFMASLPTGLSERARSLRALAMRELVGDLLPSESVTRGTKAVFNEVLWGPAARGFARQWDGSGVDGDLVDADALAVEWRRPRPSNRTALLLHQAWLARHGRSTL